MVTTIFISSDRPPSWISYDVIR